MRQLYLAMVLSTLASCSHGPRGDFYSQPASADDLLGHWVAMSNSADYVRREPDDFRWHRRVLPGLDLKQGRQCDVPNLRCSWKLIDRRFVGQSYDFTAKAIEIEVEVSKDGGGTEGGIITLFLRRTDGRFQLWDWAIGPDRNSFVVMEKVTK